MIKQVKQEPRRGMGKSLAKGLLPTRRKFTRSEHKGVKRGCAVLAQIIKNST